MKLDTKSSKALVIGGITLAVAFVAIAIVRPRSLDWIFHPGEGTNDQIKREMERQGRADARPGGSITPTPSPGAAVAGGDGQIPNTECISRDQVVKIIGDSKEAKEGRVIGINVTPDGNRITVAYRKKTFLGIGSGENQIEGILRRGLSNRFPDRLIESMKVRSEGKKLVRQRGQNVNVEVLVIKTLQAWCRS